MIAKNIPSILWLISLQIESFIFLFQVYGATVKLTELLEEGAEGFESSECNLRERRENLIGT